MSNGLMYRRQQQVRVFLNSKMVFAVVAGILLVNFVSSSPINYADNPAVKLFQEYIQINTTTYNDLEPAVQFWQRLADEAGVTLSKYVYTEGMPVLVLKWPGTNPSLNSIMLNSHMDVVPAAEEDGWTYPPFSGHLAPDGKIYGRGTQDMKSVAIQYYEALRRLKSKNVSFLRDVYMTLMPDEEVGGRSGMRPFSESAEFAAMNVGFELDEGGASPMPIVGVLYQDKSVWQIRVDCHGIAGHGSAFPATNTTASGKCNKVIDNLFKFREDQHKIALSAPVTDASIYTSLNLNVVSGGTANNVLPNLVSLTFDIRLNTRLKETEFKKKLEKMIYKAGDGIDITYIIKDKQTPATITNSSNPYWNAVMKSTRQNGMAMLPVIASGATDARVLRAAGVPALGMSPMPNTPALLHAVNEYLGVTTFLNGIGLYESIISELANIPASDTDDPSSYLFDTRVSMNS